MNLWKVIWKNNTHDYVLGEKFYQAFLQKFKVSDVKYIKEKEYLTSFKL